jgi:hypothetical protein
MIVEIDQSGKLEQLNTATAIAFADGQRGAIWLRVPVKRTLVDWFRKGRNRGTDFWPVIFALAIFILIDGLPSEAVILIDEEYTGKESRITQILENLLEQRFDHYWQGSIRFGRIGKSSSAHRLAWWVHRSKNRQRFRSLKVVDFLKLVS